MELSISSLRIDTFYALGLFNFLIEYFLEIQQQKLNVNIN